MSINDFVAKWRGKKINFDAGTQYNGQCTQLVKQWAKENGWVIPNGGGQDARGYKNFTNGYTWIPNTLRAVPLPGDIAVFNLGNTGHVAVVVSANLINLTTFDQNYPVGSSAQLVTHYFYRGVMGWLRPHNSSAPTQQTTPVVHAPQATPAAPVQRIHVVARGESLSVIARKYYGDPKKYTVIASANKLKNPNVLSVGQKLIIP